MPIISCSHLADSIAATPGTQNIHQLVTGLIRVADLLIGLAHAELTPAQCLSDSGRFRDPDGCDLRIRKGVIVLPALVAIGYCDARGILTPLLAILEQRAHTIQLDSVLLRTNTDDIHGAGPFSVSSLCGQLQSG